MEQLTNILVAIDNVVWGPWMCVFIMAVGLLLTCRLGVLQFRKLPLALKYMVKNEEGADGEVSSFGALCTAMAATIGTGNIVGVATAVVAGGPGALFWMILAACFGMATKYSEGLLAVKFRKKQEDGKYMGGPFYYIENGMGKKWKPLAKMFALFGIGAGLLGIGTITQVNGIASAVQGFFDPNMQHTVDMLGRSYSIATVATAIVVAVLVALVVVGGLQRIANVTSIIVPFMAIVYVIVCACILIANVTEIPSAIVEIFAGAFGLRAAAGGALGALMIAMQKGVARGIFSNEAGLGSAPIAAAAAQTREPVRQGLVSMTGTFIDTIVICTMTGLVTGAYDHAIANGLDGAQVTSWAFGNGLGWSSQMGAFVLMVCLAFFAFTTILGWDYYSERCFEYLTGKSGAALKAYRWVYVFAVLCGPFITVSAVWTLADICNGLMAIPNLIALFALSGVVAAETKSYFSRLGSGEIQKY